MAGLGFGAFREVAARRCDQGVWSATFPVFGGWVRRILRGGMGKGRRGGATCTSRVSTTVMPTFVCGVRCMAGLHYNKPPPHSISVTACWRLFRMIRGLRRKCLSSRTPSVRKTGRKGRMRKEGSQDGSIVHPSSAATIKSASGWLFWWRMRRSLAC
jgi:hypothetical protein